MAKRIKLVVAYDGRPFEGWQSQPSGNTVQDTIEAAIHTITSDKIRIHGSGRTDTGVHALGQVAHFDAPDAPSLDADAWQRALNANLPPTIRLRECTEAAPDFHARYSALGKTYRYEIDRGPVLLPQRFGLAWHLPFPIDETTLREAASLFEGEHDFAAFAANRRDGKDVETVRTIEEATVYPKGDTIALEFTGNGFLYKMVRLMTGALVRVSQDRDSIEWLRELIDSPADKKCQHCAPADGLTLISVRYP